MNAFFKTGIVIFFILVNVLGLMCLDFAVHDWKYLQPFNFGIFVNSFFYDYLKIQSYQSEEEDLYLGECTHIRSIEGGCYQGQELLPYDNRWYDDIEDYWFVKRIGEPSIPKVLALSSFNHVPKGHKISIEVRNFTLHEPTFSFEKMEHDVWKEKKVKFMLVDSLVNTGANKIYFKYIEGQEKKRLSCQGTIRTYEIDSRAFDLGQYRIIVHLEDHQALVENVEIVANLPIEWTINKNDFVNSKSLDIAIKNNSNYTIYYQTWDLPNRPRLKHDLTIYRNGKETIVPFGGFGCATGVYLQSLTSDESIVCEDSNPLFWRMDMDSDTFPTQINRLYGDSVGITFELLTILPIWANYETQDIRSETFIVKTADLLKNWEENRKSDEIIRLDK